MKTLRTREEVDKEFDETFCDSSGDIQPEDANPDHLKSHIHSLRQEVLTKTK